MTHKELVEVDALIIELSKSIFRLSEKRLRVVVTRREYALLELYLRNKEGKFINRFRGLPYHIIENDEDIDVPMMVSYAPAPPPPPTIAPSAELPPGS